MMDHNSRPSYQLQWRVQNGRCELSTYSWHDKQVLCFISQTMLSAWTLWKVHTSLKINIAYSHSMLIHPNFSYRIFYACGLSWKPYANCQFAWLLQASAVYILNWLKRKPNGSLVQSRDRSRDICLPSHSNVIRSRLSRPVIDHNKYADKCFISRQVIGF